MTRVLQVGVGGFGAVWLGALDGGVVHDALVDRDAAALAVAAERTGVAPERCFTDLDAALAANGADMALVVVPPSAHRAVAERCLERGLPVLVEKPLAGSREDSLALVQAARRTGRELAVSQNYRYRPVIETARRVVASSRLGRLGQARIEFRHHHDFRGTFREAMEHPLLLDMAVHHFDLIRFVCGVEPRRVSAASWNPPWSQFAGDASAVCVFEMEGGARVVYEGSWHPRAQFTDWNCRWLLEFEGGYLIVAGDRVLVGEGRDPHEVAAPAPVEVPLVALALQDQAAVVSDFMRAVRAGEAAPTAAADNLRSLEMVFGAVESAEEERPVELGTRGRGTSTAAG
jgi:predicted dehydrogenase